jgi:hypothetical protein
MPICEYATGGVCEENVPEQLGFCPQCRRAVCAESFSEKFLNQKRSRSVSKEQQPAMSQSITEARFPGPDVR